MPSRPLRASSFPCTALALAFTCVTTSSLAQPRSEEYELAMVYGDRSTISIATGSRQPLRRAPAVATVITAEDIAAMGATDLDDVLEAVPGLHVGRSNQGYAPLYLIRGIHSEFNPQTLMLQNGVPMTTLFVGNRGLGWGGLPVENIARIEIIRGPGSALYGADAYSGVINIVTKTAADVGGTEFGVRAGSFKTSDGWWQYGGRVAQLEVAAYLRVGHSDGFKRTIEADHQTALDGLFMTTASLAPGPVSTGYDAVDGSLDLSHDKLRLRLGYKLRDNLGSAAGVASAVDPVGSLRTQRLTADVSWDDVELADHWRLGLRASLLDYRQKFRNPLQLFPPGAFGGSFPNGMFGAPFTWERQLRSSAVATYSGLESHQLRIGIGYDDLDLYRTREFKNFSFVTSGPALGLPIPTPGAEVVEFPVEESFLLPHRRIVKYAYAQDEWNFAPDWTLTAGVRRDHYSDFGGTTNPRLALVWDTSLELTAKLLAGRAFRAPALTEQHSINNPVIRGNPDLQPETIKTLEAAFAWQARADTQVNLSVFRYRMKNIIRTSNTGSGIKMFNNVGSQRGKGLELESTWDASRQLRLAAHYAYQHSIDESNGQEAGYAPRHHLFARVHWSLVSGWRFGGQVNHVAERKRAAGDIRAPIADYTTLDLSLRTQHRTSRWEFGAAVRNLFNADVREPSLYTPGDPIPVLLPNDLPMARRSLYLQAVYRL